MNKTNSLRYSFVIFLMLFPSLIFANYTEYFKDHACDVNGKVYYFSTEEDKNENCFKVKACDPNSPEKQMSCTCSKLILELELSTAYFKEAINLQSLKISETKFSQNDLVTYKEIERLKLQLADQSESTDKVNPKQIKQSVAKIQKLYRQLNFVPDRDIDIDIVKLQLDLLQSCVESHEHPCETLAEREIPLPTCVLPKNKSLPVGIFPPSTPLKTLLAIDRINDSDKSVGKFTRDKIGNFLCKAVPGRINQDGSVHGKLVLRPIAETQELLNKYILSDANSDNEPFVSDLNALKKHPCFDEVGQNSHFCKSIKIGCKREYTMNTEQIKRKLQNEFKYLCLQSLCETQGENSIVSYDYLEPFLYEIMQSVHIVRDQKFNGGDRPFGNFCRQMVFNKKGAYIPGIELEYPYLRCEEQKYKKNSLNIIHGESNDDLKCFSNYEPTLKDKPNQSKYESEYELEMHTAIRCMSKHGTTYKALRGIGDKKIIKAKLEKDDCWSFWDRLPKNIQANAIQTPETFSKSVVSFLQNKYLMPPQNAGLSWNPIVENSFENLVSASTNHFVNYKKKIRLMKDESLKAQRDSDSCGEPLTKKALQAIDKSMPFIAGAATLAATIYTAPEVVIPSAVIAIYMGMKSAKNISARRKSGEDAINFINNSGIASAYSGMANFHLCAQNSCGEEQKNCMNQLYSADKDEFIRKMWNRNSCLQQRDLAYAWDGVGVVGGMLGGVTFLSKVPTPTIDRGLHALIDSSTDAVGISKNTSEGVGTGLTAASDISTRLATRALESRIGKLATKTTDRVTIFDGAHSTTELEHILDLVSNDEEIPCMQGHKDYENFYNQLQKSPDSYAKLAEKLNLTTFMSLCKLPHSYGASDILPDISETSLLLEDYIATYCGGVTKKTEEDLSTPFVAMIKESEKLIQQQKAEYTLISKELRIANAKREDLKISLLNLEKEKSLAQNEQKRLIDLQEQMNQMNQLNDEITKLSSLANTTLKKINYLETEQKNHSNLISFRDEYSAKSKLIETWEAKVLELEQEILQLEDDKSNNKTKLKRTRQRLNFVTSYTIPKLERDQRKINLRYKEEIKKNERARKQYDLPEMVPADLW